MNYNLSALRTLKVIWLCVFILTTSCLMGQGKIAIKHGPYLQNLKDTEVTLVWLTNAPSVGWVELAPDDDNNFYYQERPKYFDTTNGVKNTSLLHSVKIKGLTPGSTYRYRVYSQEVLEHNWNDVTYGKVAATDVYYNKPLTFTTSNQNQADVSFIMLNDIHGRVDDIEPLLTHGNLDKADLVIYNGDMVSQLSSEEEIFTGFMDETIRLFAKEKPMYYARGNHETRGKFATSFQEYFSPKEPNLYYLVRYGSICFVILDTGEDKPDTDIEYSGITDYDSYRTEQAAWLSKAVQSDEFLTATYKIVIAHIPPLIEKDMWHGQKEVLDKFVPILNKADVDIMLSGHTHEYSNHKSNSNTQFPILVNGHKSVVKGTLFNGKLTLEVLDKKGKQMDKLILSK